MEEGREREAAISSALKVAREQWQAQQEKAKQVGFMSW